MAVTKSQVLDQLKRIKGPDLEGNIVDLGLVSEILLRDDKVYFSITVPPDRAAALEPLRQAAEKVVKDIPGVQGVTAVLTAETARRAVARDAARSGLPAGRQGSGIPPPQPSLAMARAVSTIRFEKPHSLSYQLTTRTSLPSSTAVSRLSIVELAPLWLRSIETSGSSV